MEQNRKRKNKSKANYDYRKIQILTVAVIFILAAVVIFFMFLFGGKKETPAAAVTQTEETVLETEEMESETESEEMESLPEVAADVADMKDAEDPQSRTTENGAAVDVAELNKQVNNGETAEVTIGIDVAKYQDIIDWNAVKGAGVQFAMIRAGYRTLATGVICEDPLARYNMQEAQAAGLQIGVYFFSTAVTKEEAAEEAAWLTQFISQYKITYPVAYNCENFTSADSRQNGMTKAERTECAVQFLNTVKGQGYTPMFYASRNEMEGSAEWDMNQLGTYKVWVSQYPASPYPQTAASTYSGNHQMWQYTNQGTVPGIAGKVDIDVAYFGYTVEAQAKSEAPAEIVAADPEVNIRFTEVNETVTAKIETNLRTVPSTADSSTIAAKLVNPETAARTGIGHNGWSRVIYNGQKYYAVSNYLTTDLTTAAKKNQGNTTEQNTAQQEQTPTPAPDQQTPAPADSVYRAVNETVTAKEATNVRSAPDKTDPSNVVGTLRYGEAVNRVGIGSNGWSQISINGQIVYAVSGYLTAKLNYQESSKPTAENPDGNAIFTPANDQVTAKSVTNLRTLPSADSEDTIAAVLHNGEVVTRVAIGSNGWSKISYNGQTLYAITSYLAAAQ